MVPQQSWTEDSIRQLREQEGLPFVRADASGVVREINQRFHEVYGWRDDQLLGQSLGLILPRVSVTLTIPVLHGSNSPRNPGS